MFSLSIPVVHQEEVRRRDAEAKVLWGLAGESYKYQLADDRHILHGHPAGASSWARDKVMELVAHPRVGSVVGHQSRYGQWARAEDGSKQPVLKATRRMISAPEDRSGWGANAAGRGHPALSSGRAAAAAVDPPQLCRAILRGAEAQRRREGEVLPPAVQAELAHCGG